MDERKRLILKETIMMAIAFFLPLFVLIFLFDRNNISLFSYSGKTILAFDMQSQYICYLREYRNILLNGGSLVYTNTKVFGGDYSSIFINYLASPFNYFVVFFQEEALPLFFAWTSIIRMSFASLNFYLLMRFYNHKFSYKKIVFAIGYGLISYSFVYMSNFMWLDAVMILPLVILGIYFVEEKKNLWLYPLALVYALMTSWYIGFMVLVFAILFFIYRFAVTFKKDDAQFLRYIFRFCLFSVVGLLISSIYWLTAYFHYSNNGLMPANKMFSLSMFLSGLFENNYSQTSLISQNDSYITMFVGSVPLVFFILYFFNKEFSLKDRLGLLAIFLFYFIFSLNSILSIVLQGGVDTVWFPARYSFVIGFLVCFIATISIEESHKLHPLMYLIPFVIGCVMVLIVTTTRHSERLERYPLGGGGVAIYLLTIFVGFSVSLFYQRRNDKKMPKIVSKLLPDALLILLIAQVISSYRGGNIVLGKNYYSFENYKTYLEDDSYSEVFNKIKKYDKDTYRSPYYKMESTFNRIGNYNLINNNPTFYSFNGLSNTSSSNEKDVAYHMRKLGFHYNYYFNKYERGSTYSINSLLGIKYLVEDKENEENLHPYFLDCQTFEKLDISTEEIGYYYNPKAINLGFISDKSGSYYVNEGEESSLPGKIHWFDHFEYQNEIFKTINNQVNDTIFKPLEIVSVFTNVDYQEDEYGVKTYQHIRRGNTVKITFKVQDEALNMPLYFGEKNNYEKATFTLDEERIVNNYWTNGIASFPDTENHLHELIIRFNEDVESIELVTELYYEDLNVSGLYLNALKENEFVVTKVENSLTSKGYKGTINVADSNKDLVFTLPHKDGIKVFIDGKEQKTQTKLNIFTAVSLENVSAGNHQVTIKYQDDALVIALPITIVGVVGLVPLVIFYKKIEDSIFAFNKHEEVNN